MRTFASLFTGGGLADIGAKQAGYSLLWGVELDPAIAAVAQQNLGHPVYQASVVDMDWATLERPDHLHMSPPCQDFSVAKSTGKVSNDNDALAQSCIDAIKTLAPSTVTLENVEGYRKAKGFQAIVDALWGLGYWVNVDVLNSADFGVPQTRRRLILRAVKGGFPGPLPEPVKPWKGWYQAIEDLIPTLPETQFAAWQLKRLPKSFLHGNGTYSAPLPANHPAQTITSSDNQTGVRAYLVDRASKYRAYFIEDQNSSRDATIRGFDEPVPTVISGALRRPISSPKAYLVDGIANDNGATVTVVVGSSPSYTVKASSGKQASRAATPSGRVVRMTPRALARFQTMPDWYALPEKTALACRIIGNGVPCLMMQRIMEIF
jgi:DNA (cytosine-5)-methyltransferase 1